MNFNTLEYKKAVLKQLKEEYEYAFNLFKETNSLTILNKANERWNKFANYAELVVPDGISISEFIGE